jgi:hypothetical protein
MSDLAMQDGGGVRVGFTKNIFVSFFYAPPTVERLEWLFDHEKRAVGAMTFSAIAFVDPRVGKEMTSDARKKAKEIADYWVDRMAASVTVVQGTGFFPAMVRSVLAGVQLLSERKIAWHVAGDGEDAIAFVKGVHAKRAMPFDEAATRALCASITKL